MRSGPRGRHPLRGQPAAPQRLNGDGATPDAVKGKATTDSPADAAQPDRTEREGLMLLLKQLQELRAYVTDYAVARTDSLTRSVQGALHRVVPAALTFVAVGGVIVIGCWLVLSGVAQGATALCGGQAWIGTLVTGVLTLAAVILGMFGMAALRERASRNRTVRKYETRDAQERTRFGRDVHS